MTMGRPPLVTGDYAKSLLDYFERRRKDGLQMDAIYYEIAEREGISYTAARLRVWKARRMPTTVVPFKITPPEQPEEPADPIEVRRHKESAKEARALLVELEKRLVRAEDIRGEVMGLGAPVISKLEPDLTRHGGRRAVILHVSDIQYGEVIDPEAVDGLNSYSIAIANARIARYFQKAHRFITELWQGDPAEEIIVLLNGDMVSGALHHELDRTDGARPMQAAKMVAEQLIAGLNLIREEGFPIRVINTPGNHGRMTHKPESKDHVLQNWDTLVGWFIEMAFLGDPEVRVVYSKSVDALFNVFAFPMLVTHGDRIGSRGGQGFLGATATIVRGHFKLMADYAARGTSLYKVFTGHFHTNVVTPSGYSNSTMAGPSEYSRDGRMGIQPASQDYFVVHEDHGVIEHRQIMVGSPEEGSCHAPVLRYRAA
jgi:hypothetical protein